MKNLIEKILDNIFYCYLISFLSLFIITIPTSDFYEALFESLFFGFLAIPLTGIVLELIEILFFKNQN